MNTRTFVSLLLVLGALVASRTGASAAAFDVEVLRQHTLVRENGEEFTIGDLQGKVVVVNFWASWCKPCRKELPELSQWKSDMDDVEFVAISIDQDIRKARRLVERENLQLDICFDGADGLARKLDLDYLPCTFVLDQTGQVALVTPGVTDERMAELHQTIRGLRPRTAGAAATQDLGRE